MRNPTRMARWVVGVWLLMCWATTGVLAIDLDQTLQDHDPQADRASPGIGDGIGAAETPTQPPAVTTTAPANPWQKIIERLTGVVERLTRLFERLIRLVSDRRTKPPAKPSPPQDPPSSSNPPSTSPPPAGAKGGKALLGWLQAAGLSGEKLRVAWAVGMAESGGNPRAHNDNPRTGDNSYGLFQINMIGSLGPDRRRRYGLKSNEDLFDPMTNIRVMLQMSGNCTNWQPWSAYKNGAYKKFYDQFPPK